MSGWWFGTFVSFHVLGIIIPTDYYFSEGLKPPTRCEFLYVLVVLGVISRVFKALISGPIN